MSTVIERMPALDEELVRLAVGENHPLAVYGVLHHPRAGAAGRRSGVVLLGGWSGTRVGPHGILTQMARDLAEEGFPAFRFDYRGRGDSEGTQSAAHIGAMVDDAVAAAAWLRKSADMDSVILLGVCAGAMVAMGAAPRTESLAGLALWSPPPFHPDPPPAGNPQASTAPARPPGGSKKRFRMLQQYVAKIADPRTWAKLAEGQLQPRLILKILMGKAVGRKRLEATGSSNWAGPKPDEILYEKALPGVAAPALFIYGSSDPDREEAVPYYTRLREPWADVTRFVVIQGANHSFYSLEWKAEVIRTTLDWICTTCSTSST